jgi:hypothetical protein
MAPTSKTKGSWVRSDAPEGASHVHRGWLPLSGVTQAGAQVGIPSIGPSCPEMVTWW